MPTVSKDMKNFIEGLFHNPWFIAVFVATSLLFAFFFMMNEREVNAEKKRKEKEIEDGIFDGVDSTSRALLRKINEIIDELSMSDNIQEKMKKDIRCIFSYLRVSIAMNVRLEDLENLDCSWVEYKRYERKKSDVVNRNKLIANSVSLYQATINDMYNNIDLILKSDDIRTLVFEKITLILKNTAQIVNAYEEAIKVSKEKEVKSFAKAAIEKINSNFAMDHELYKKLDMYKQVTKIHEELNEK